MGIIVQKFGGTSVQTPEARAALVEKVKMEKALGHDVVVVVSAMGREGEPYATDTLINLLKNISDNIDPRKKDFIMSCGETISSCIVSYLLEHNGIPSEPLTGLQAGVITTNEFNNSDIIFVNTSKISRMLKDGKVPVITGFQGTTSEMEITTLGRGGSDTSAVVIGAYLDAARVDIYTDVKGIAEIDPRIVPEAKYINAICYSDILEIASNGAKVIHPKAIQAAQAFEIPITVRSTFTNNPGTLIDKDSNVKPIEGLIGITLQKDIGKLSMFMDSQSFARVKKDLIEELREQKISDSTIQCSNHSLTLNIDDSRMQPLAKFLYYKVKSMIS